MKLLYEGKAKRLYETETAHKLPMEFKDDATTFDGQKKAPLDHRGCRLWDVKTGEQMDKDRFRRDLGDVMKHDAEVLKRAEHAADA